MIIMLFCVMDKKNCSSILQFPPVFPADVSVTSKGNRHAPFTSLTCMVVWICFHHQIVESCMGNIIMLKIEWNFPPVT